MQRLYKRPDAACWWCSIKVVKKGRVEWLRRSTGQRDRRAAEKVAAEFERAANGAADKSETPLAEALKRMIAQASQRGCAQGTLKMYATKSGHWLRILGEDATLADITAHAVDRFIEQRTSERASRATIGKELTALRLALKTAKRRGEFTEDIAAVMPEHWDGSSPAGTRHLTRSELDRLLLVLKPERAAHIAFLAATGADWSASLQAVRTDVDLVSERVFVRGSKTAHRERELPIVGFMSELLERALCDGGSPKLFKPWENVRHDLEAACRRAGIPKCTPRDLRRTFGSWLRQAGVETHLIAKMLGHADARMVERIYGQLPIDSLHALMRERLGDRDDGVHKSSAKEVTATTG